MALKRFKPTTPSRRYYTVSDFSDITKDTPEKSLVKGKRNTGGRNVYGRNTNINKGGGHKRLYRTIDFARTKVNIPGKVIAVEYDPNRSARIALIQYADGEKRYILCPVGLGVGEPVINSESADIKPGNTLPLKSIPTGQPIHNLEVKPGGGGQLVRSAGVSAQIVAKEGDYALIRMPSGEVRKILGTCLATVGVVSNPEHSNREIGKAGRSRWLNRRPHNRGVTKNPVDHPMGGGQGKSSGGRHPCSPNGLKAKGLKTRSNKRTDKFIIKGRARRNVK